MYRIDFKDMFDVAEIIYCFMTIPSLHNQECSLFDASGIPETILNDGDVFMTEQEFRIKIALSQIEAIACVASTDMEDKNRVVLSLMPGTNYLVLNFPGRTGDLSTAEANLLKVLKKEENNHHDSSANKSHRRRIKDEISRATMYQLFVVQGKTDSEIADLYHTQPYTIKRLRTIYDVSANHRTPLAEKLPIELFYRMYVVSRMGLGQIADLVDSSRTTITALKDHYAALNHPLSAAIAETNNCGYYPRHLAELRQIMSAEELISDLKTKTLNEIAALRGLIPMTANGLAPMTKEWLQAELQTKSASTIAKENHLSLSRISVIMKDLGIENPSRVSKLSEEILRELYLKYCWSDQTIAKHIGVSAGAVKNARLQYGIHISMRPSDEERIPPDLFHYLYVTEGMSLLQIGDAYGIADARIRTLKQKYLDEGHTELQRRGPKITNERLEYLRKLIHLNRLEISASRG